MVYIVSLVTLLPLDFTLTWCIMESIDSVFLSVLRSNIFKNRDALSPDYIPEVLPHREDQIKQLGGILAHALKGSKPGNVFIYGLTGTGKTAVTKYVLKRLVLKAKEVGAIVKYAYVNCRQSDTPYRVLADIAEAIGIRVPFTGLSIAEVYRRILRGLFEQKGVFIIVLDELDYLVKRKGDDILYRLLRINEENIKAKVSLVCITNDVKLLEILDPRVRSSLGEEEIVFPPYNALELKDILTCRAKEAFNEEALEEDVIPLCAALAAKEHGDARRALDLLRVAGEIAERENSEKVTCDHVKKAYNEIERNTTLEIVKSLPLQAKIVLHAILLLEKKNVKPITTGHLYSVYANLCRIIGVGCLTQRRISDIISQLDTLGLIATEIISRGRHGRTRIIKINVDRKILVEALKNWRNTLP